MNIQTNRVAISPGTVFIGFSGKKQTGKDTSALIAKKILKENNKTAEIVAFADPLKQKICIDILGIDPKLIYGSDQDKNTLTHISWDNFPLSIRIRYSKIVRGPRKGLMTIRELMQVIGTDIFRNMIYDPVWAQIPFRQKYNADVVILLDIRLPNEKIFTELNNGTVIRLERNTGLRDKHSSETALDGVTFTYTYQNNGSLSELEEYIRGVLQELKLI